MHGALNVLIPMSAAVVVIKINPPLANLASRNKIGVSVAYGKSLAMNYMLKLS